MNRGKIYSVSHVNQFIKNMFSEEYALSAVFVKGEISNCKYHSSGHIYFTIKDESSQLTCVMFRGDRRGLDFTMENGQEVVVGGSISVYERDGKYQLYAKKIVLAGDGLLAEKYEKLKQKLAAEGYLDEDRKLPIPKYVKRVGVVTAKTGAAIQDIVNISTRRNPYVQLILCPAKVQGEGAAETIAVGIHVLEQMIVVVIIVGRGGGSMVDLWAFNEEIVAQAIFGCTVPVISAVGHETDFTIADFVADLRAPTPSAAAELAVYDVYQLMRQWENARQRLVRGMERRLEENRQKIVQSKRRLTYLNPGNQIKEKRQRLIDLEEKICLLMEQTVKNKRHRIQLLAGRLDGVSPLKRLAAGYAFVADEENNQIDSITQLSVGQPVKMTMQDGEVHASVERIESWN
ncbi:MAG: exodeoxyribonuclease VII large subunit [Eubacterium sp.]|nr:exodeoxyribonuclease VII large subunit [Eubacterium sp.]